MSIPRRLVRTVPEQVDPEQERLWRLACDLHPGWEQVTHRGPGPRQPDPAGFPLTGRLWQTCQNGSQWSDLVRAEELYHRGGVFLDSDVECYRPFDALLGLRGFSGFEDAEHVCAAVMGFEPGHPALKELIDGGIERHAQGAWAASIGVVSEKWPRRDDMVLFPPGTFYPYHFHYKWEHGVQSREQVLASNPWAYCAHHWAGSWKK